MLDFSLELQQRYENSTSPESRKEKGQVFTPAEIARFMASLFSPIPSEYYLLDPGAGIGSLTVAVCERVARLGSPRRLIAHLFENDAQIIPLLKKNLENSKRVLEQAGHRLEYAIHVEDFILATSSGVSGQRRFDDAPLDVRFDGVIMNPPYFKVRKDSPYARVMDGIVHGQPNVYAFFMALAARLLKEDGELVAVTPRSFCNGLYFRGFREWFFRRMTLDHIHLFESRIDAFKHSAVLQESIVTKARRLGKPSRRVSLTASFGRNLGGNLGRCEVPAESVLDNSCGGYLVRVPESPDDLKVMMLVESLSDRFAGTGLRISTGPVVMFRAKDFLLYDLRTHAAVPLLLPHNVRPFETVWPLGKNGKPLAFKLCQESLRLLLPTRNYILLKRFSAKEEKRRLTAGCFLRNKYPLSHVGIENHVNYIHHAERELSEDEVYGVAAVFNSALYDRYFRILSGNTQVNATEIRTLNFPALKTLAKIGRRVRENVLQTETIVSSELGVTGSLRERLLST